MSMQFAWESCRRQILVVDNQSIHWNSLSENLSRVHLESFESVLSWSDDPVQAGKLPA